MNSRERVLVSISHQIPDMISVYVMGIESPEPFYGRFKVSTDVDLRMALGVDIRQIRPDYVGPEMPEGLTIWGTASSGNNAGYSDSRGGHPLPHFRVCGSALGGTPWFTLRTSRDVLPTQRVAYLGARYEYR